LAGEKMNKLKISTGILAVVLLAVLTINIAAASILIPKTNIPANQLVASEPNAISAYNIDPTSMIALTSTPNTADTKIPPTATIDEVEKLKEAIPKTLEEAEASIVPTRTRFLMYTSNGVHIMWGVLGNGRFIGTDNNDKHCWGIYGQGIFAGFYDGQFFWGKYSNGAWKAEHLFGLRYSQGNYVLFPQITPTLSTTQP
jgi:hypothetical protein